MDPKKSASSGGPGFRLAGFPKEFERNFWESFDGRYYSILFASFIIFYGFAFLMAFQDWSLSQDQIDALKERAIKKIYDVELIDLSDVPEEEDLGLGEAVEEEEEKPPEVSEKGKERVEESQADKVDRRKRAQVDLEAQSRKMQQDVANQGILAIATSAGASGSGNVAYTDVLKNFGEGKGVNDMSKIVEGTTGIGIASSGSDKTRAAKGSGHRSDGTGTGIDDLISGESVSGNASFDRRGDVKLTAENVKLTAGAGSRDPETITASINNQNASIEYCYQKRAKINPNLRGRIDLEIEIGQDGHVTSVRTISSTLADRKLDACINRAIKRWRFGKVDTGVVRIKVPFIF